MVPVQSLLHVKQILHIIFVPYGLLGRNVTQGGRSFQPAEDLKPDVALYHVSTPRVLHESTDLHVPSALLIPEFVRESSSGGLRTVANGVVACLRELQAFLFVFEAANRIVVEKPEYANASYFFDLEEPLPVAAQVTHPSHNSQSQPSVNAHWAL